MYQEQNIFDHPGAEQRNPGKNSWQQYLPDESADDDPFAWTIRDILTLLLIFFIMLYTSSLSHQSKTVKDQPVTAQTTVQTQAPVSPSIQSRLHEDVTQFMNSSANQGFSVRWEKSLPVFVLGENITFATGEADLRNDFQPILEKIAAFIAAKLNYQVIVSGHTDNTPIATSTYPSNWELSAARAASVARFLAENGVPPEIIAIHGYAEYKPLLSNTSRSNRQANRRVEIKLALSQD